MLEELLSNLAAIPITDSKSCSCGEEMAQEHHLIPQSTGGTNARTVWLCPTCHDKVHAQARVLLSSNPETRKKRYITSQEEPRLMPVAKVVALATRLFEQNKHIHKDVAVHTLMIEISPMQLKALHTLKERQGFTSLNSFMEAVIAKLTGFKSLDKRTRR